MLTEQTNVPFQTEKLASTLDVAAALLAKLEQKQMESGVHEFAL